VGATWDLFWIAEGQSRIFRTGLSAYSPSAALAHAHEPMSVGFDYFTHFYRCMHRSRHLHINFCDIQGSTLGRRCSAEGIFVFEKPCISSLQAQLWQSLHLQRRGNVLRNYFS